MSFGVILTRDAERAARCLRGIATQAVAGEVILVLCEPDASVRRLVADGIRGATVIDHGVDLGTVFAWQEVLDRARSPAIHFLHEDTELAGGCTRRLLDTLRATPDAGAVGGRTLNPDRSLQACGGVLWNDAAGSPVVEPPGDEPFAVDSCQGACAVVGTAKLRQAGGFDPRFFPSYYVDANMCMQLWHGGHAVLCDPRAEAVHARGAMLQEDGGPFRGLRFRRFLVERNRRTFADKWAAALRAHAARRDPLDASSVTRGEIDEALRRAEERRSGPPPVAVPPLPRPQGDVAAHVRALRAQLVADFADELVRHEADLTAELERVHLAYASLLQEHDLQRERANGAEAYAASLRAELDRR